MALPNAPMPLAQQAANTGSVVVTVPLKALGAAPGFADGGNIFNVNSPTATFTITLNQANRALGNNGAADPIIQLIEQLWREGTAVAT